jgi:hypothetical protein
LFGPPAIAAPAGGVNRNVSHLYGNLRSPFGLDAAKTARMLPPAIGAAPPL